ncbi:argininosuccinate lyase [Desulfatibacillum aliphaticivorans]|uniref:Argininosuccinate lyase n=1 Tax=Desulfatibacillum aliphaticivorans TaxID=218208 RepID=ARLY_DESAL|nr:argininosuccinate lyase [Desulfatibacillum aliphaticivorans]B8FH31.1 RecName: Full=Argininosuccinate lyase; Short=ASAL; AltName: Full=Arginosuccinase [Desulfatibacillum aliphaticivorans]ACL02119.1 Argininosuccinate lyase [Desulfatibacillum aliphaticivorans]
MAEHKPWDGRFAEKTDDMVEAFTSSIQVDKRLYAHDITGSIAHARTLAEAGVITSDEADAMEKGLRQVKGEIEAGNFKYDDSLEDIHMHIESRLTEILGPTAAKLHTGRSRNDQIALDNRLYLRDETRRIIAMLHELRQAIVDSAQAHLDYFVPGYTHLQRAQPVLLSHHLMAYYEMFTRDSDRFTDALYRINVMPLGSAALAGTTFPLDREYTASLLGFEGVTQNSMDAVSDRDFIMEFLSDASICMVHLSRMSEELVLWSSSEFAFLNMPDAFATGSSIMPQKKNPDVPELVRGKTGRVVGSLMAILTTMKSLPMAYNRDMQEDKPPLFDAVDTLKACVAMFARMVPKLEFNRRNMFDASNQGFLNATDMADYLVEKGVPFREAHGIVGRAVAYALDRGRELHEISLNDLRKFSDKLEKDLYEALTVEHVVERRRTIGGTASVNVIAAIGRAQTQLQAETSGD